MYFRNLKIKDWQQFKEINLDFHENLTIITGANASGKTTILNLLARHCNWNHPPLALPKKNEETNLLQWLVGKFTKLPAIEPRYSIGMLTYADGQKVANLYVPSNQQDAQYNISIEGQIGVNCFYIPSHRSIFRYKKVTTIPASQINSAQQAFTRVNSSTKTRHEGQAETPSSYHIKELLISWSIFGEGNSTVESNPELLKNFQEFEEVLRKMLPKTLGFRGFIIRGGTEVVLECDAGDFVLDGASGGISAIIELAWQIYFYSVDKDELFTVIIDEIENHLHPTMQRQILPDLITTFPKVKFIVSTHSPLIVGSVKNANVYALRYEEEEGEHKVVSQPLDLVDKAKTASEILDEVLGVSFTMPIWAEESLKKILSDFEEKELSDVTVSTLKEQLESMGLGDMLPEASYRLLKSKNDSA